MLVKDSEHFTLFLTEQVCEILKDKYVRVDYVPSKKSVPDSDEYHQRTNYAFCRVQRFSGNIGYLDLIDFDVLCEASKAVAAAAMYKDALIVELRSNGGGYPDMIAYLTSYLFSKKPIHLNSM